MSVNMNLSFEIHNIKDIHSMDDDSKRDEIIAATKKFLQEESLDNEDIIIDFLGQEGYLAAYTPGPIIISGAYRWVPEVSKRWEEMAFRTMGPNCKPLVNAEYADEED